MILNDETLEANNKRLDELLGPLNARQIQWVMKWWQLESSIFHSLEHRKNIIKEHFLILYPGSNLDSFGQSIQHTYQVLIADNEFEWIDKKNGRQLIYLMLKLDQILSSYSPPSEIGVPRIHMLPRASSISIMQSTGNFSPALLEWNRLQPRLNIFTISPENRYSKILEAIDNWDLSVEYKRSYLTQLRQGWEVLLLVSREKIKWFDAQNIKQVEWSWDYLRIRNSNVPVPFISLTVIKDKSDAVLASLDLLLSADTAENKLFLLMMSKAWSQKKFRDSGKLKKPFHLPLTKESHNKLTFLAQFMNKSEAQVLTDLIEAKHLEVTTDENGERRKY